MSKIETKEIYSNSAIATVDKQTYLNKEWCKDCAACHHMTFQRSWFSKYMPLSNPEEILVENGRALSVAGKGEI